MPTDKRLISETTPAAASTVASTGVFDDLDQFNAGMVVASLVGASGGTLDVYLQTYDPLEKAWFDYLHFPQLAAGASAIIKAVPITRNSQRTASVTIGSDLAPALAADVCVGGDFGSKMRAVFVAGVGTSAGAAVVIRFLGTKLTR